MGKQTSLDVRKLVINFRKDGKFFREIASIIGRSHNTVKKIIDKQKKFGELEDRTRSGRPKRLSDAEMRSVVRAAKIDPTISAVKMSEEVSRTSGLNVSASTIRRALHANGLHGRVPRKKPHISTQNQKRRLQFAEKYKNKDKSFWNNVIFFDESTFEGFRKKKSTKIWRNKNQEFEQKNITSTV